MSVVKVAFIHYQKIGPNTRAKMKKDHEDHEKGTYRKIVRIINPIGSTALQGFSGHHIEKMMTGKATGKGALIGATVGAGFGLLGNAIESEGLKNRMERINNPNSKWITFGSKKKHEK